MRKENVFKARYITSTKKDEEMGKWSWMTSVGSLRQRLRVDRDRRVTWEKWVLTVEKLDHQTSEWIIGNTVKSYFKSQWREIKLEKKTYFTKVQYFYKGGLKVRTRLLQQYRHEGYKKLGWDGDRRNLSEEEIQCYVFYENRTSWIWRKL